MTLYNKVRLRYTKIRIKNINLHINNFCEQVHFFL